MKTHRRVGRPPLPVSSRLSDHRITISVTLKPKSIKKLAQIMDRLQVSRGEAIDILVEKE